MGEITLLCAGLWGIGIFCVIRFRRTAEKNAVWAAAGEGAAVLAILASLTAGWSCRRIGLLLLVQICILLGKGDER